jgi:O-antigen ligase
MLNRNAGAMTVVMALCVFSGVFFLGGVNPYFASPVVVLTALLAMWQAVTVAVGNSQNHRGGLLIGAVVCFVFYAVFRYWHSIPEYEAREELTSILVAALVYLVALGSLSNRQTRAVFVYGLMGLAILESVYGAWQAFSKATTVLFWERPEVYDGRGSGTYVCPNHFAGFLEMVLGLVVARAIFLRNESKSIERATILKVVTVYGSVMIAGGLIVTMSRGGWLAGGVGLLAMLCLGGITSKSLVPKLAIVGAVVACAGGFLWSVDSVRNYLLKTVTVDLDKQQVTLGDPSLGGRIYMWKGTLPLIRENPVLGTGIGSWKWEFQKYHSPQIFSFPDYAHNDYLNLASDYGLIGVILLMFVFAAFFTHAFKVVRRSQSSDERAFAIGAISGVISILVHSFFDFNLHILANSTLLAAMMGSVAAIPIKPSPEKSSSDGRIWRLGIALGMISMVALLACLYVPTLRGYHEFEKGNAAKAELAYTNALAHYEAAARIDSRFAKPLVRAGDILKDQAGWRLGLSKQQERKDLAIRAAGFYERALVLNPLHADVWIRKAQARAMAGDHASALSSFLKAIEIAPANAYAHFALGRFYNDQGEEQKALESLQKANNLYFHTEPMFFMNAVEAEERIRSKIEGPK